MIYANVEMEVCDICHPVSSLMIQSPLIPNSTLFSEFSLFSVCASIISSLIHARKKFVGSVQLDGKG